MYLCRIIINIKTMNVVGSKKFTATKTKRYKAPDDDFRRAISMDEFIERALVRLEKIDKMYAKK